MNELPIATFLEAIQATHGTQAVLASRDSVTETFEGEIVWTGEVLVFDLLDHATAPKCYAWSVDRHVTTVLHEPPVDTPQKAVRAAIVADHGQDN